MKKLVLSLAMVAGLTGSASADWCFYTTKHANCAASAVNTAYTLQKNCGSADAIAKCRTDGCAKFLAKDAAFMVGATAAQITFLSGSCTPNSAVTTAPASTASATVTVSPAPAPVSSASSTSTGSNKLA